MMLQCKQCQDFRTLTGCQLCCRARPALLQILSLRPVAAAAHTNSQSACRIAAVIVLLRCLCQPCLPVCVWVLKMLPPFLRVK